jgi:hypothetical protein
MGRILGGEHRADVSYEFLDRQHNENLYARWCRSREYRAGRAESTAGTRQLLRLSKHFTDSGEFCDHSCYYVDRQYNGRSRDTDEESRGVVCCV